MQSSTHHCSGWLPRSWSNLLETYPWLPSYFGRLVLDASELEVSKATEALAELPVVEASMDMVTFEISHETRYQFTYPNFSLLKLSVQP